MLATVITYVNPAVAVALGAAVLGEPLFVISFEADLGQLASGDPPGRASRAKPGFPVRKVIR